MFAVGVDADVQLSVAARKRVKPSSFNRRLRRVIASSGLAPKMANPMIGRTLATMAPAIRLSTRLPLSEGGSAPVVVHVDDEGEAVGLGIGLGVEIGDWRGDGDEGAW